MNIVLTGAEHSLGEMIRGTLMDRGHDLYGLGLYGPDANYDFEDLDSCDTPVIFDHIEEYFGCLPDVLINNAGITSINFLEEQDVGVDWYPVMHVNLTVPYLLSKEFATRVHLYGGNNPYRVVNIASMGARVPLRASTAYCASKAGLVMMTKQMARECAGRLPMTFMSVSPNGIRDTNMMTQCTRELVRTRDMSRVEAEAYVSDYPLGKMCTKHDVADLVAYVATEACDYMTGHNFEMVGGTAV